MCLIYVVQYSEPHICEIFYSGRCGSNIKRVMSKHITQNRRMGTRCEIALRWMTQNLTNANAKSTSIQVGWGGGGGGGAAARQQDITGSTVDSDICHHMTSIGHDGLKLSSNITCPLPKSYTQIRHNKFRPRQTNGITLVSFYFRYAVVIYVILVTFD